jgi:quercetin dioxygenase-like cupin family protein
MRITLDRRSTQAVRSGLLSHKEDVFMSRAIVVLLGLVASAVPALAQDPVKVAPNVYSVVFENDQVRVLRAVVAPGDKTPMHEHPANVVVPLTAAVGRFTLPDGTTQEANMTPGTPVWSPAGKHRGENLGTTRVEAIIVELKS